MRREDVNYFILQANIVLTCQVLLIKSFVSPLSLHYLLVVFHSFLQLLMCLEIGMLCMKNERSPIFTPFKGS